MPEYKLAKILWRVAKMLATLLEKEYGFISSQESYIGHRKIGK
jgi:hypothetical protein